MVSGLYNKEIECPVCSRKFNVTKVKASACKVESIDSDFCIHYKEINPIFYDVLICEHCGYAAHMDKFSEITYKESKLVLQNIASKWSKRSFAGERSIDVAIEAYKLALYNLNIRNARESDLAKVCIRLAWLYRECSSPKENEFLKFSLRSYTDAYENERFPVDKLDEYTCMYMIGELNRRLGQQEDAVKWFSKIISSPGARTNKKLLERTREQYMSIKDNLEIVNVHSDN